MLGADFSQILERINSRGVLVGPLDAEGVVADELGFFGDQRAGVVAGEDGQQRFLFLRFFALGFAGGAGAHRAEIRKGISTFISVLPSDDEALVAFEVEIDGGGLRGHVRVGLLSRKRREYAMEQRDRFIIDQVGDGRIVAGAFVAHESVFAGEFENGMPHVGFL
jgi:hypothetical protein